MAGDVLYADLWTLNYIRSKRAFDHARTLGKWDLVWRRLVGRTPYLLAWPLRKSIHHRDQVGYHGLSDLAVSQIVGSLGRHCEFSYRFLPVSNSARQEERWRLAYLTAAMGTGYRPVVVHQHGDSHYVLDGHHRVSVARYLGWTTIQAHVFEPILGPVR